MNELAQIERWLTQVVIALNLCPFAEHPWARNRVRIEVFTENNEDAFKDALIGELQLLNTTLSSETETTLIATPQLFGDFFDFNLFLEHANVLLKREGLKGKIQIASFHPAFQFTGVSHDDKQNLTNKAPYPIFHLIREDSLAKAIEMHPDTESIYQNNIERMQALTDEEARKLFPYL